MHTAVAFLFFATFALLGALGLASLGRRGLPDYALPAARTVALITATAVYVAALFHLGAS